MCQLVAKIINVAVERGSQLDSSILNLVENGMLERIQDKVHVYTYACRNLILTYTVYTLC